MRKVFLCQQAKIDWLKNRDRNKKFFHAVVKGKNHMSRVAVIYNERGEIFEGTHVPEQL